MSSSIQLPEHSRGSYVHSAQSFIHPPPSSIKLRRRAKTMSRDLKQTPHKKSFKDIEEEIAHNHQSIINILDHLEDILQDKLQVHEKELLKVFKFTLEKITNEIQNIADYYNKVVEEVKLSTRMVEVQNQLEFFRNQALLLFQQNKSYKDEIKKLKIDIQVIKDECELKDSTVKSLAKKVCRLQAFNKKDKPQKSMLTEPNAESPDPGYATRYARSTFLTSKYTRNKSVAQQRTHTPWVKIQK